MEINQFIYQILFLFIPGLLGSKVFRLLKETGKKNKMKKNWEDFSEIFLITFFSYIVIDFLSLIIGLHTKSEFVSNIQILLDGQSNQISSIIIQSSVAAIFIAIFMALITNCNLINKLGNILHLSNQYSENDVWHIVMKEYNQWFYIRDEKADLTYRGYIDRYSDAGEIRELLLKEVSVYDTVDSSLIYEVDSLYICRDQYDLSIEVSKLEESHDAK